MSMTSKDKREFKMYLEACTDRQVREVYDKERAVTGRRKYAQLAKDEADMRGIALD